jgi:hypothetical protein
MGQIDKSLQLATAQADVRAAGTYYTPDCIDLGHAKGRAIPQERGRLQVRVDTAYAGGTSVEFQAICSDTPWTAVAGTGATNVQILASSGAIAEANLKADTIVWEPEVPARIPKRYFGVRAVGIGVHTGGTHDVNIVAGPAGPAVF